VIADALWYEIVRALEACYPDRAAGMVRALERDRNSARVEFAGRPVTMDLCNVLVADQRLHADFVLIEADEAEDGGLRLTFLSVTPVQRVAG
jgi:hypothetical protein